MALRQTKKISELPALSPASLDTTFVVGISGSTTYKISINNLTSSLDTTFATDLVTSALSNTLDTKLSTSSFNSYTASISTGSLVTSISNLNTFTASQSTSSLVNRLNAIESVSGSWITESETGSFLTSLNGAISSSTQISDLGFVTGSYTTINSFNSLTQSFNSISQSFNVISGSVGTIDFSTLATTASNTFIGNQTISGSTYISGGLDIKNNGYSWSFDSNGKTRIPNIIFNSDRGTGMVGIKPVAGREFQIETSTAESSAGPWVFGLDGTLSAPNGANILRVGNLVTTASFNSYTASQSTSSLVDRLNTIESVSGSWIAESETGSFLTSLSGAISSSSQLTSSYDTRYTLSGSVQPLPSNLLSSSAQITAFGFISSSSTPAGTISGSAQITTLGFVSGSYLTSLSGAISSSSQLTSSYDSRYSLSGSVLTSFSSSVDNRLDTLEATIISGSPNYTQVLGNRRTGITSVGTSIISGSITTTGNPVQIMVTGDANPITTAWVRLQIFRDGNGIGNIIQVENSSNLNVPYCLNVIDTPSAGTYTYSMRTVDAMSGTFDFGESTGPLLTAVELKTNTNLPSTNNTFTGTNTFKALTTISGSLVVSGSTISLTSTVLQVGTGSGDEGGEILLAKSQTNNSLTGSGVTIDSFQNRLRIFEQGGNARGVHIDLTKTPEGVAGELLWKASGIVNAGTFVTLDNIKATVTTTSNRGLSVATVTGTVTGYISAQYQVMTGGGNAGASSTSLSTTATTSMFGWNFTSEGDTSTYILRDNTNNRVYRIILIIGGAYNNNFISIERLY